MRWRVCMVRKEEEKEGLGEVSQVLWFRIYGLVRRDEGEKEGLGKVSQFRKSVPV